MVLLLQAAGRRATPRRSPTSCTPATQAAPLARRVAEALRDAGAAVVVNAGGGSFKSQMKKADASGARVALIIGDDEAAAGTVAVKPLRGGGEQTEIAGRAGRGAPRARADLDKPTKDDDGLV